MASRVFGKCEKGLNRNRIAEVTAKALCLSADVEIGLCDFPFMLKDKLVFLCWKSGEDQVHWWHDIDSGYADRQPIDEA